jgi:2-dehydro-3-deoxygluconokinase
MTPVSPVRPPAQARNAVLCVGELLFRLGAPGHELLLQSPRLEVHAGGAEANVAVALAHFGHVARMASVVPHNRLGEAARAELRRLGVDAAAVIDGPGRMGLYFYETGAMQRPSEVLYDRESSAFARVDPTRFDWHALLDGVDLLHVSGVTPAVSANAATLAVDAVRAAAARGIEVSFDGNFRSKLWEARGVDPRPPLHALLQCATIAFADHRDMAVVLGLDTSGLDAGAAFGRAAEAAFAAFPRLRLMAATRRDAGQVGHQNLGAQAATREQRVALPARPLQGVVDRIGAGDAFAAGLLHGLRDGRPLEAALRFALAAGCLKHALPGDVARFGVEAVEAALDDGPADVRR